MIYTPMTRKAMKLAYDAHHGQLDKAGVPYVFHPLHLAESMTDETSCTVALLHDVVEDTSLTFEDLQAAGFPETVLAPLRLLTHAKEVPYMDYIHALKDDPVARRVKLADLAHNSDTSRLEVLPQGAAYKLELYRQSTALLTALEKGE